MESVLNIFKKDVSEGSDHTPESAGRIKIVIDKMDEEYELRLESNGRGITEEELRQTFSEVVSRFLQEVGGYLIIFGFLTLLNKEIRL
jgi:DNA topoisomerase VI subunit B